MPLYNDKDQLLEILIEREKSNLASANIKLKKYNKELIKIKNSIITIESNQFYIKQNLEVLKDMFSEFNKPQ